MALPTSRNELIEYALRELGSPVINIEYDSDQLDDRIDYILRKFVDRHYDGATEAFYIHPITKDDSINGYITLPSDTTAVLGVLKASSTHSIEPFDSIQYYTMWDYTFGFGSINGTLSNYTITMQHLSLLNFVMGSSNSFTYNTISKQMQYHSPITYIGSSNLFKNYKTLEAADWTKTNCTVTDNSIAQVNGDLDATEVTSAGAGVFGVSNKYETQQYIRGMFTTEIILQAGTYTGSVDIIMEDRAGTEVSRETVALTNMWVKHDLSATYQTGINDVVVRFETTTAAAGAGETFHIWSPSLYANNLMAIHCYKAIDPETIEDVWHQEWIMKYVTALIKKQWGSNTKKYQGVQLPGGIEITGQTIFDEAVAELEKLDEQFSMEYELPVDMYWG